MHASRSYLATKLVVASNFRFRRSESLSHNRPLSVRSVVNRLRNPSYLTRRTNVYTLIIVRVEWDPLKAGANRRTHGVSFAEAVTVLEDNFALTREDPDAAEERRFVTLGMSNLGNLFVLVYAYRESDIIRVISAWKANKRQRELYEKDRS